MSVAQLIWAVLFDYDSSSAYLDSVGFIMSVARLISTVLVDYVSISAYLDSVGGLCQTQTFC